jgi:CxxC motif-containing protein (DUF1111 family)
VLCAVPFLLSAAQTASRTALEAPAGFDNESNGHLSAKMFDDFRETFEEEEEVEEGLGPVFNEIGCANCHSVPVTGGGSEVLETRAGTYRRGQFTEHPGGSLVHDKAISPEILEKLLPYEDHTFRTSLSVLGDGFIEAIADETIVGIANSQPSEVRGLVVKVPVLEANNALRVGRFGWKNQHASLESFAADAYLNEMGITSPLAPFENSSDGNSVVEYDEVPDPEDDGDDIRQFAEFMRATKAPPRGPISSADDQAGLAVFTAVGCATCHVPTIVTAPTGTPINGGAFRVPPALGNKVIHPFSDLLLHDVGTKDPIIQNGGPDTFNKVRTPPLWGLRTRTLLMHDGKSTTVIDAIRRHGGQAARSTAAVRDLPGTKLQQFLTFLASL